MATINEELFHAAVDHAIDFTRYNNSVARRMIALLNRVDADLFAQMSAALERLPAESFTVDRLDAMLASVKRLNAQAYKEFSSSLDGELHDLTDYEASYQLELFDGVLPTTVSATSVNVEQVYAAAMARPFQGRLLSEWASSIADDRMARIRDALRMGYVEGQTISQMVQRIRGTKARRYEDGIIEIDRRNAASVVRTATSHVANFTRQRFYDANADLIKGLRWTSTLDGRTSPICQSRDGTIFPVDSGPRPPAHWGCRSTMVPVLKSWREMGIDMDELPPATRASIDGQVPADMTYQQWLKKQPPGRQDDILGPTRGKLFRDGGLSLDRFVDRTGTELTLEELRARNARSFREAGFISAAEKAEALSTAQGILGKMAGAIENGSKTWGSGTDALRGLFVSEKSYESHVQKRIALGHIIDENDYAKKTFSALEFARDSMVSVDPKSGFASMAIVRRNWVVLIGNEGKIITSYAVEDGKKTYRQNEQSTGNTVYEHAIDEATRAAFARLRGID